MRQGAASTGKLGETARGGTDFPVYARKAPAHGRGQTITKGLRRKKENADQSTTNVMGQPMRINEKHALGPQGVRQNGLGTKYVRSAFPPARSLGWLVTLERQSSNVVRTPAFSAIITPKLTANVHF